MNDGCNYEVQSARLSEARQKLKDSGSSPKKRGREKIHLALDWIYRWGYSSPTVIDVLSGASRRGFPSRLIEYGFCVRTRTSSGGGLEGVPAFILTLTPQGVTEVERHRDSFIDYKINPFRVNQANLRHDLIAQKSTVVGLVKRSIVDYKTEREMAAMSESGVKQPDAVWILETDEVVSVEVELTAKFERKLDDFILKSIIALQAPRDGGRARFDRLAILSDSPAIIKRYRAAMGPDRKVNRWVKDGRGHWKVDKTWNIPVWLKEKVLWLEI